MQKDNKIFFQLWNAGLINQVMSLELAVGLAEETGIPVAVHYCCHDLNEKKFISSPSFHYNDQRIGFTDSTRFPHILDLIDLKSNVIIIDEKIDRFKQQEVVIDEMVSKYYYSNKEYISEKEMLFAEGRERLPLDKSIHLKGTLGFYSRFFYDRSPKLNEALSSVKFKKEYVDLAKKISSSLGKFQGMHLRLSEHQVHPSFSREEIIDFWLRKYEENGLPIVFSTEDPSNPVVVKNKHRVIMLDEFIVNNFSNEFKDLPFQDEVVFGLICNLVLHDSVNFVGKSGSTYTSYIQRARNQKGIETWDFFDSPPKPDGVPYSWVNYPLDSNLRNWWREWEESKF